MFVWCWVLLSKVVAVLWCCKGTLKIVVELPVFYWLQFAVWSQAQDSNSHIFGIRRTNQVVWRVDEAIELVKALEPNLPTPAAFKEMYIELLLWIWRIVFILFLCILLSMVDSHLVSLFVILKNPWSDITGKLCLKQWLIAVHYVKIFVAASIKEVRTWNLPVCIHYMDSILLADVSEGVLLQALAFIKQALNFGGSGCSREVS